MRYGDIDKEIRSMVILGFLTILILCGTFIIIYDMPYAPGYKPPAQIEYTGGPAVLPIIRTLGWSAFITTNPVAGIPSLMVDRIMENRR